MPTQEITKDTFNDTINNNQIVLVDWWASWCGPCRSFAPVFEEASGRHADIVFGKIDTEAQPELAAMARITSIPTIMAFREGVLDLLPARRAARAHAGGADRQGPGARHGARSTPPWGRGGAGRSSPGSRASGRPHRRGPDGRAALVLPGAAAGGRRRLVRRRRRPAARRPAPTPISFCPAPTPSASRSGAARPTSSSSSGPGRRSRCVLPPAGPGGLEAVATVVVLPPGPVSRLLPRLGLPQGAVADGRKERRLVTLPYEGGSDAGCRVELTALRVDGAGLVDGGVRVLRA